jgi:peptidoglycan/LPS O-acetylase OafA/YrhL
MAPVESAAARMRRQGLCNGFGAVRLGLACAIVAFHSVTLTHGSGNAMPPMVQAAARLILPAFFALSGFLVAAASPVLPRCVNSCFSDCCALCPP